MLRLISVAVNFENGTLVIKLTFITSVSSNLGNEKLGCKSVA